MKRYIHRPRSEGDTVSLPSPHGIKAHHPLGTSMCSLTRKVH